MGISDRNYAYFNRKFNKSNAMNVTDLNGITYYLQKVK